jgi:8-amino-3,8-dideoxy-alpha-D-manno-octulosonate transaminase
MRTSENKMTTIEEKLAIEGGKPARTKPLPLEFPGVHHMDDDEINAALRVLKARSPFRHYGINLPREPESFESELASFLGIDHALAVTKGSNPPLSASKS